MPKVSRAGYRSRAVKAKQRYQDTGNVYMRLETSGKVHTGPYVIGRVGSLTAPDPAVTWAYRVRRLLKPIRVAPTTVTDTNGKPIATITVDPITGIRTRKPIN